MIRVNVSKDKIEILGHSGYDIVGKDIVCSAVSSIVITTINGIISIYDDAIYYENNDSGLFIEINKHDLVVDKLIDNMIDLLKSLSKDYPKNINVKER